MKKRAIFLFAPAIVLAALLLRTQTGQTQTPAPTPPPYNVASEMAPAPDDCGPLAQPIAIDPMIPHAVGVWPIWVSVPDFDGNPRGALYVPDTSGLEHPDLEGWWASKIAWFIPISYTGTVTLQAAHVDDGSPIYFEFGDHITAAVATLDAAHPGGFVEELTDYAFFPSHLWVSKAGCYRFQAEWDGGRWEQVLAVGFMEAATPRP
jgi:hypothetical protein